MTVTVKVIVMLVVMTSADVEVEAQPDHLVHHHSRVILTEAVRVHGAQNDSSAHAIIGNRSKGLTIAQIIAPGQVAHLAILTILIRIEFIECL